MLDEINKFQGVDTESAVLTNRIFKFSQQVAGAIFPYNKWQRY
jgi:hypothetical protein